MNARTPDRPAFPACWIVAVWPDDSARYLPIDACVTRAEALAEVAQHPGAVILFRPAPKPASKPQDEFLWIR